MWRRRCSPLGGSATTKARREPSGEIWRSESVRSEMAASGVSGLRESGASWERAGEMETVVAASARARKQVRRKEAGMLARLLGKQKDDTLGSGEGFVNGEEMADPLPGFRESLSKQ